jgi:hypothetical protein
MVGWLTRVINPDLAQDVERLEAECHSLQVRIDNERAATPAPGLSAATRDQALAVAQRFLDHALRESRRGRIESAWQVLHDAQEQMVETFTPVELRIEANRLLLECPLMKDSAHAAVIEDHLRNQLPSASTESARKIVRNALDLNHRYWEWLHYGIAKTAARVAGLSLTLALAIAAALVLAAYGLLPIFGGDEDEGGVLVAAVVAIGLSSLVTATKVFKALPEQARDGPWHHARPLIGAGAALLVVSAVASGFLGFDVDKASTYLAIAAGAGFSEAILAVAMGGASRTARRP